MKETELKPCPLCGSAVKITEIRLGTPYNNGNNVDYSATIECVCGLSFEKEWTIITAKDGAVYTSEDICTAWNRRANNEQREAD